jgi:hypothetical protein
VRHTNFAANLRQEGAYSEGGAYMLVYTVQGDFLPFNDSNSSSRESDDSDTFFLGN